MNAKRKHEDDPGGRPGSGWLPALGSRRVLCVEPTDYFALLPDSLITNILALVASDDSLLKLRRVCRRFRDVIEGSLPELWLHFDLPLATRQDGAARARRALQAVEAVRKAARLQSASLPVDPDWLPAAFLSCRTWGALSRLRMYIDGSSALDLVATQCPRLTELALHTRPGVREDVELDGRIASLAHLTALTLDGELSLQAADVAALLRAADRLERLSLQGLVTWAPALGGLHTLAPPASLASLGPLPCAATLRELRVAFDTERQGEQWLRLDRGTMEALAAMPRLAALALANIEGAHDGAWGPLPPAAFPALARLELRTRSARETLDAAWFKAVLRARAGRLEGVAAGARNVDAEALELLGGPALEELELGSSPHVDDAALRALAAACPALRSLLLLGTPAVPGGGWLRALADSCPRLARLEVRPAWQQTDPLATRLPDDALSRLRSRGCAVSLLPAL